MGFYNLFDLKWRGLGIYIQFGNIKRINRKVIVMNTMSNGWARATIGILIKIGNAFKSTSYPAAR